MVTLVSPLPQNQSVASSLAEKWFGWVEISFSSSHTYLSYLKLKKEYKFDCIIANDIRPTLHMADFFACLHFTTSQVGGWANFDAEKCISPFLLTA